MAIIAAGTVVNQGGDGSYRWAVIALRKVTTGDTVDVSAVPVAGLFSSVISAAFFPTTKRDAVLTSSAIAGTVVTISTTGVAGDGGFLFVIGEY